MKTTTRLRRLIVAGALACTAVGLLAPAADAHPASPTPAEVAVPAGNRLFLVAHAEGVQIYACTTAAAGPVWTFVAPRADLYLGRWLKIGTHYAGPTWELADGSKVVATRDAGVIVDPSAIPWLRLSKTSTAPGRWGDLLGRTTFIQRTNTVGGIAPAAAACTTATVGTSAEVPYTADYAFWMSARG